MIYFFGDRWDAPILDDATEVAPPIGEPCSTCGEPIAVGDRGFVRPAGHIGDAGELVATAEPVHHECDLLGIVGHQFGVCSCTGFDTSSREAARELLRRVERPKVGRANDHGD